jgi:hypothetical protein
MFEINWDALDRRHEKMNQEFMRLCCEPCGRVPAAGDRVLVAGGLIGKGHMWARLEATVVEVADTACKVRFLDRISVQYGVEDTWVHNALITDVMGPKEAT